MHLLSRNGFDAINEITLASINLNAQILDNFSAKLQSSLFYPYSLGGMAP